jgi:phosphatidylglycerophosphate synthase
MGADLKAIFRRYRSDKLADELSGEWAVVLLYRGPALLIAAALLHTPVSANAVTIFGITLLPLMALFAYFQSLPGVLAVCVAFLVLDCVDGTLARERGRMSERGAYLDFTGDILYRLVAYGALGHLLGGIVWCIVAAWLMVFARLCRQYAPGPQGGKPNYLVSFFSGLDGLLPLLAPLLGGWLACWLVIYGLLDAMETNRSILKRLKP